MELGMAVAFALIGWASRHFGIPWPTAEERVAEREARRAAHERKRQNDAK